MDMHCLSLSSCAFDVTAHADSRDAIGQLQILSTARSETCNAFAANSDASEAGEYVNSSTGLFGCGLKDVSSYLDRT